MNLVTVFKLKIKKGDTVQVLAGKDRGKQGKVERLWPKERKVLVTGVNQYKKHMKRQKEKPGEIISLARPMSTAKVALVCPKCKQPTRVGYEFQGDKKIRVCRKCKAVVN